MKIRPSASSPAWARGSSYRSTYRHSIACSASASAIRPRCSKGTWRKARTRMRTLFVVARDLEMAQALGVPGNAAIQRLRQLLAVVRTPQQRLFLGIAEKSDLRQDGWHAGADQDHERRLLDAAVLGSGAIGVLETLQGD